jgi:hypothetical protein
MFWEETVGTYGPSSQPGSATRFEEEEELSGEGGAEGRPEGEGVKDEGGLAAEEDRKALVGVERAISGLSVEVEEACGVEGRNEARPKGEDEGEKSTAAEGWMRAGSRCSWN